MNQTEHAMDFSDFMSNIQDYFQNVVLESSKNSNVLPKNFTEHFQAFATAINWKEPFIVCLYTFQIVLFVFVLFTRNYFYLQCFIFMMICGLISIAELLNDYGSKNWKQIATQDYFDEHGFFAGALFAGPLLVIGFTQLVCISIFATNIIFIISLVDNIFGTS